ncbi:hypothetical protein WMY93_031664 [Mugilogobius chulae]|uniref:Uncharacterized protein n=1 Tax=Mugilogobius chulae TaxID=88201 RepID=A0AAW0MKN1_9GOBI
MKGFEKSAYASTEVEPNLPSSFEAGFTLWVHASPNDLPDPFLVLVPPIFTTNLWSGGCQFGKPFHKATIVAGDSKKRNQTSTATDMSSTRDRSSEETFMCSICLELFSEPVSTPCGHNFCKRCISEAWDTAGSCTCPVCNEVFSSRPELKVNTLLCETSLCVLEGKMKRKRSDSMEEKPTFTVQCDVCSEPKLKALKSCLLMEPVENLEDRLCPEHQRPLELFCHTDQSCICTLCFPLEHKTHDLLSLEEACSRSRFSLLHTQAHTQHMVEQRRLKLEEIQRCLELSDTEVHRERAEGLQVFTALMQSVQRRQELFLEELQEKQKLSHKRVQELVQQLEQEICELQKAALRQRSFYALKTLCTFSSTALHSRLLLG